MGYLKIRKLSIVMEGPGLLEAVVEWKTRSLVEK